MEESYRLTELFYVKIGPMTDVTHVMNGLSFTNSVTSHSNYHYDPTDCLHILVSDSYLFS